MHSSILAYHMPLLEVQENKDEGNANQPSSQNPFTWIIEDIDAPKGSVTVDFDRYRVCSLYRPVQDGPRTDKPSDRYVPPIPGGTGQYGKPCCTLHAEIV
ncbi:hypothetical protein B296_00031786 [Ensete ventricosum]|uniref:Uncharacterized protein n=1 Tax=Ensete ventricosum TaxID=4639 RepID=A0A426XGL7_ENSVE|nr:hypothetical protein B296_00031786 [Ensete ventricosum]